MDHETPSEQVYVAKNRSTNGLWRIHALLFLPKLFRTAILT